MPQVIEIEIPDAEWNRVKSAIAALFSIPMDDQDPPQPQFTEEDWVGEWLSRYLRAQVKRSETAQAQRTAAEGISVEDTLATRRPVRAVV